VYCQLGTLRRCLPAVIGSALNELPKSLDETYERTLLGIEEEKREFAHRLFQCLTVAIRPLRVDELAEVLAIRFYPGQLPQYHVGWKLDNAQEAVLSTCSSLISVVNVDGSPVVQFSHFSVKEFLTSDRLAKSTEDLSRYHIVSYSAHTILAQACLSVLLHFGDQADKDTIKKFPFAQYAAQHWVDHGRFEDVSSRIQDAMERLFDGDGRSFATWIWIYDIDYPFRQHMFEDRPPRPEASALYYATLCGFHNLVEHLIAKYPGNINTRGGRHGSALNAALVKRNLGIALLLFGQGAHVDTTDASNHTPLWKASESGRRDDVELLLKHHADVNLLNGQSSETALIVAAHIGEVEIAQVLLCHGASVDLQDNSGWTPLKAASRYGHLDIVQSLIRSGAAVDTPNNQGWTPLILASRNGHLPIAQVLIDHGGAINAPDTGLSTPLHYASAEGHLSVVQLLIEHHADVCKRNQDQQTPLHRAAAHGRLDIARLLLKSRSSPNSQDNDGSTPLHTAAHNGHLDLVKLLVESGADVNMRTRKYQTPLAEALASRKRQVTRYLANHMGVTDPCDGMDIDPLDNAPDNLVPDATSTSVGNAKYRHLHGRLNLSSLHDACAKGSVGDVQSLLDQGADINGRDVNHGTPLFVALLDGNLEMAKVLIQHGADVNCRDKFGWTPLMLASQFGYRDIAELLLDHGADVNAKKEDLWTALHLASSNGHLEIVKDLLDRDADIHARNIDGHTPSGEASRTGERDIIGLLSGVKVKSTVVRIFFVPFALSR